MNPEYQPVRLLGVGLSGLSQPMRQMDLFDHTWEKDRQLLQALDSIRNKYGPNAVKRAVRLKRRDEYRLVEQQLSRLDADFLWRTV